MANSVPVKIYGRTYNIRSDSSSVPPERVAAYVDGKMCELSGARGKTSTMDLAVLAGLNIAHELLEARKESEDAFAEAGRRIEGLIERVEKRLENIKPRRAEGAKSA
ncbi:MAG: cell division protein ZapA [Nitrospinaceae bacterium]|jgi:cell division protein ZapA|nr:MAG: cell division protein ZapA [Nitrospinaceae bacterium]